MEPPTILRAFPLNLLFENDSTRTLFKVNRTEIYVNYVYCSLLQTSVMPEDQDLDNRAKGYRLRRSIMDYGMGTIIFCLGIFFLIAPRFGIAFDIDKTFRFLFGGLCIIYGLFRVYRGYKKNYFN